MLRIQWLFTFTIGRNRFASVIFLRYFRNILERKNTQSEVLLKARGAQMEMKTFNKSDSYPLTQASFLKLLLRQTYRSVVTLILLPRTLPASCCLTKANY